MCSEVKTWVVVGYGKCTLIVRCYTYVYTFKHVYTYVGLGFRIEGLGFRIEGLGFSGYPSATRAQDAVVGSGIRVEGLGCWSWGMHYRCD